MPLSQKEATCLREGAGEGAKKDELNPRVRCAFGNVFLEERQVRIENPLKGIPS